ncbi:hypothetical protein K435DRAFT_838293 [Dendrothele bispora CBS 962.96]|uniref:Uncharacterized protein n=1 Tax=Dendrothele bispora (strain CBS 962.96) TaxID=1314807 RepID=A0A4S8M7N4_DENBC|nr:hypothetical protein K435DRAFT_838293 [Dendrothele bispora CBS 962.96]
MVTEWDPYIFLSGIHGYQWDPWVSSMGSVGFHGSHGIHGIYGLHGLLGGFLCKFPSGFPAGLPSGLPAGLPSGLPAGLPSGLPAGLPSGLPAGLPGGLPAGLPGTSCPHLEGQFKSTGGHRVLETSTFFHFWDSWDLSDRHAFGSFFNRWQHGDEAQTSGWAVVDSIGLKCFLSHKSKFFAVDLAAKSGVSIQVWRISESGITAPIGRPLLSVLLEVVGRP